VNVETDVVDCVVGPTGSANKHKCTNKIYSYRLHKDNKKAQLSLTNPRDAKACQKLLQFRDDHGNGIPIPIGNPLGIPWEWELMTQLGMEMGRNRNHPVGMGIGYKIGNGNGKEWELTIWEWEGKGM